MRLPPTTPIEDATAPEPKSRKADVAASAALERLAARIAALEQKPLAYQYQASLPVADDPDQIERAYRSEEGLERGLAVVDRAEQGAILDEGMQQELDEVLPEMDREANKQFWQRFFAGLDAGTIELPEVEPSAVAWPRENEAREVTGESSPW